MDELTRENIKDRVKAAVDQFLDGRAEKIFRAQVDLMNLSADIAWLRYKTEVDIVRLECEERVLYVDASDRYVGGTGKEREAKAYLDEKFVKVKREYEEAIAFARYLSKTLDQLAQLEESIRYKSQAQAQLKAAR